MRDHAVKPVILGRSKVWEAVRSCIGPSAVYGYCPVEETRRNFHSSLHDIRALKCIEKISKRGSLITSVGDQTVLIYREQDDLTVLAR